MGKPNQLIMYYFRPKLSNVCSNSFSNPLCASKWGAFQTSPKTLTQLREPMKWEGLRLGRRFWVLFCPLSRELLWTSRKSFSASWAGGRSGHLLSFGQGFCRSLWEETWSSTCLQSAVLPLLVAERAWQKWGKILTVAKSIFDYRLSQWPEWLHLSHPCLWLFNFPDYLVSWGKFLCTRSQTAEIHVYAETFRPKDSEFPHRPCTVTIWAEMWKHKC